MFAAPVDPQTGLLDMEGVNRQANMGGLLSGLATLAAAYAPSTDPGARARGMAMMAPAMFQGAQQHRQGLLQDYATNQQVQGSQAWQKHLAAMPEQERALYSAMGPQAGAKALLDKQRRDQIAPLLQGLLPGLTGAAAPAAAAPGMAPAVVPASAPGLPSSWVQSILRQENGTGNPAARNPRSSAMGNGQFINSTWLDFAKENPTLFQGMSEDQILAARANPDLSRRATEWYGQKNGRALADQGLPVNAGTVSLAHFLGPQGAAAVLRAPPTTPVANVLPPQVIQANPFLANKTAGELLAQRGGGNATPTAAPAPQTAGAAGINPQTVAALGVAAMQFPELMPLVTALSPLARHEPPETWNPLPGGTMQRSSRGRTEAMPAQEERWDDITPQNAKMLGLPEGASYQRSAKSGQIRTVGREGVSVTNNAGESATQRAVSDAWTNMENSVLDAGRRATLYGRAEKAIESFRPGPTADARLFVGQLARDLGIKVDGVSEGEVLKQVQRNLELAATPKGQGQITENERKLIREMVPVWSNSPEGVRQGIALLRQLDQIDKDVAKIYRDNARKSGGAPNPVTVREEVADYFEKNPMPDVNGALSGFDAPASNPAPAPAAPSQGGGWAIRPAR